MAAVCLLVSQQALGAEKWLKVRGDNSYPPYEFLDSQGVAQGFNVDIMLAVAKAMGVQVEISLGPWNQVRSQLERGEIDALTGMYYSKKRAEKVDFSRTFLVVSYTVFVRKGSSITSFNHLANTKIIVQKGDIADDYVTKNKIGQQIIRVANPGQALRLLKEGRYDCALLPRLLGNYIIRKENLGGIEAVGKPILPRRYCFAVRKGGIHLVSALNEGLSLIHTNGQYDQIYNKWFGAGEKTTIWGKALTYAVIVMIPLLLLLGLILGWSWTLRRNVAEKTRALVKELAQRQHAEQLLASREQYRKALIDSSIDSILTIDENRTILECNPAFLQQFGYTSDEIIGSSALILHPSWDHFERFGREVYPIIRRQGYWRGEWDYKHKNGSIFPMETSLSTIQGPGHQTLGYVSVMRDMTERKKAEEEKRQLERQLRQAQKMEAMGTLAGGIAHDFNNILGAVMGFAELALWDANEGKASPENLHRLLDSAKRAKELVRQILTFSRKVETDLLPTHLEGVVNNTLKLLERTIPKMISIQSRFAQDIPPIKADPNMIEQIIMNLATNASDAMPNGGVLSITGHTVDLDPSQAGQMNISPGTYVHLSFADTGEGMDERTMSQVFDPFFTTKEVGKGTGLGLSTVFGAVKSHGGTITCQSGPGEGAVFNLYFPVADQASAEPPAQQTAPENLHGNGELVLIIDDEQDLLDIGQRILLRHGYRAMTAPRR